MLHLLYKLLTLRRFENHTTSHFAFFTSCLYLELCSLCVKEELTVRMNC